MATDATNTPSANFSIPKYLTSADAPSGKGFNAAIDFIDTLLKKGFTILTTQGDMPYASAANVATRLPIGSTGNVLTVAGGVPTWAAPAGGGYPFASRTADVCAAWMSGTLSLTTAGSGQTLPLDTLAFNTDTFALSGVIGGGIKVPRAGYYRVVGQTIFPSNATGYRELVIETWNAAGASPTVRAVQDTPAVSGGPHYTSVSTVVSLAINEIVGLIVFQNSGGTLTMPVSTANFPNLHIEYLGA